MVGRNETDKTNDLITPGGLTLLNSRWGIFLTIYLLLIW